MRQFGMRATALALAALLGLSPMAAASQALGDELHSGTVGLAPGSDLIRQVFWSNSRSDLRTERYITYTPGTGVSPLVVYGDTVLSKQTLSTMAKNLEAQGYRVIGGVNGDFFDMSTGNPLGVIISDGVLRTTSGGFYAVGFRDDGSAFVGWPAITVTATFGGHTTQITDVNKTRTAAAGNNPGGYYLYTEDYSKTTQHTAPGVDVILTPVMENLGQPVDVDLDVTGSDGTAATPATTQITEPENPGISDSQGLAPGTQPEGREITTDEVKASLIRTDRITVGGRVTCTVDQVLQSTGSIDIPPGKMVLTINNTNNEWLVSQLSALQPGDTVEIDATSKDTRWNEAVTAIGGFYRIVTNGAVGPHTDNNANPRTAIGVKADGTVVIYTIDGHQPGYSVGASLTQVAQRMIELGCVDAVGLDGGGSTTIGATMPWNNEMEILNQPSDGSLRAVTNGFFLVSNLKPTGVADHLVVTPYDSLVLAGAQVPLHASAVDSSYYAMPYSGDILWSIHDGDGTVDVGGVFTAGSESGTTYVTASSSNGVLNGDASVTVVRTPNQITLARQDTGAAVTSLSMEPGETIDLTASAVYRKLPLTSQDTCYVWTAEPSAGTVDEHGLFTAADKSGTGTLTVSAGGTSVSIPVAVAGHVMAVDGFEDDAGLNALTTTDTVTVAAETASDLVRYGQRSAKLSYNAAAGTAAVMANLPISAGERYLTLWVYGDGSGNALTASIVNQGGQTADVVLTALDFTGWKQVTTALPEAPRSIQAINIIYAGGERNTGDIWLDQITTSNEDFVDDMSPVVTVKAEGTKVVATVTDNVDKSFEAAAITATRDGQPLSFQWDAAKGALTAAIPPDDGRLHRITVTATDQSGNIGRGSANVLPEALDNPDAAIPADRGPFIDMSAHWAGLYSTYLYNMGVVKGVETNAGYQFQPEKNITRGEFSLMLARWMGLDMSAYANVQLPFADVAAIPAWALEGVKAMYATGIMKGSLDNGILYCRSGDTISRAEAMTLLGRIQTKGYSQYALTFADASAVAGWALPYVESLVGQGIISGYDDNQLRPNDPVKRCEVAKMLYYML